MSEVLDRPRAAVSQSELKAAFYVPGWPADRCPNGIATALSMLKPGLERAGVKPMVLSPERLPAPARGIGARLRGRFSPGYWSFVEPAERIARAVMADQDLRGADVFEIEESFGWAAHLQKRLPMPVVMALHGPWFVTGRFGAGFPTPADEERLRREGEAIAGATAISAKSKIVLDAARDFYSLDLPQAVVIPNAATMPAESWRKDDADRNEILFVGRFDRVKGADIVLEAFAMLAAERPNLRLVFAGPTDRPIRLNGRDWRNEDLLPSIMPSDAAARVRFLGPVPHGELGAIRRRAFATVVASRYEVFGNVVTEALAHGCPLVATEVGGIPEIARDGKEALLVPSEDPGAMAGALGRLLDDPELAASLGAAGRARIADEFSPARVGKMTRDYYREIARRHS